MVGKRAGVAGYSMAGLELAGSATRAVEIRSGVADELTRSAILWDFWLILGDPILIMLGAVYFPPRAFRVRSFRDFSSDGMRSRDHCRGPRRRGEHSPCWQGDFRSGGDRPWQIAATVSWAKWLILVVIVGYVLLAAFTFMITPAWVQHLLINPPPPNVTLSAEAGAASRRSRPDRHAGSRHGARPVAGPVRDRGLRRRDQGRPRWSWAACRLSTTRIRGWTARDPAGRRRTRSPRSPAAPISPAGSASPGVSVGRGPRGGTKQPGRPPTGGGCLAAGQPGGDPPVEPVGLPVGAVSLRAVGEDRGGPGAGRQ